VVFEVNAADGGLDRLDAELFVLMIRTECYPSDQGRFLGLFKLNPTTASLFLTQHVALLHRPSF
jgi:hypothetical protein